MPPPLGELVAISFLFLSTTVPFVCLVSVFLFFFWGGGFCSNYARLCVLCPFLAMAAVDVSTKMVWNVNKSEGKQESWSTSTKPVSAHVSPHINKQNHSRTQSIQHNSSENGHHHNSPNASDVKVINSIIMTFGSRPPPFFFFRDAKYRSIC
jgi:hypothetical protein